MTFLFRIIHQTLPTQEGVARTKPGTSNICKMQDCSANVTEDISHALLYCTANRDIGPNLMSCLREPTGWCCSLARDPSRGGTGASSSLVVGNSTSDFVEPETIQLQDQTLFSQKPTRGRDQSPKRDKIFRSSTKNWRPCRQFVSLVLNIVAYSNK